MLTKTAGARLDYGLVTWRQVSLLVYSSIVGLRIRDVFQSHSARFSQRAWQPFGSIKSAQGLGMRLGGVAEKGLPSTLTKRLVQDWDGRFKT